MFDERYDVFRRDRNSKTSLKSEGGGVLIAIKKSTNYTIIQHAEWETSSVEDLWVTIKPTKKMASVNINCSYLPGDIDLTNFESHIDNISSRVNSNPLDVFIILGDYNVPGLSSIASKPKSPNTKVLKIIHMMELCNFEQYNSTRSATESNNLLDLIFSNRFLSSEASDDPLTRVDAFHPPVLMDFEMPMTSISQTPVTFRSFKQMPWSTFNTDLLRIDWYHLFKHQSNVNLIVEKLYEVLNELLDHHCPKRTVRSKRLPCWFSSDTKKLIKKKRAFHSKWKKHKNQLDYIEFSKLRSATKKSIAEDFQVHNESAESEIRENPKVFWKHVNSKRINNAGVAEYVKFGEETALNREQAADLFAKHFESVYSDEDSESSSGAEYNSSNESWNHLPISKATVEEKLSNLNINKAPGPDELPPILFKMCAKALATPLHIIFNKSIESGTFPTQWKLAHVTPIHKEGSTHDVRNYRPISKLSIAAKIFDNIVADELFDQFKDVIVPQQHGFFKKRSTVTNLIDYTERLQKTIDSMGQTDVIYTDFSKAFDKVSHRKLLEKLHRQGIGGRLLDWFRSYITGRTQRVQIGECLSFTINVSSSVVQGSHLGPLLFSIFINDVSEILHDVNFCIYADDLKFFKKINSLQDVLVMQENLERLDLYVRQNNLSLNRKKCVVTSFSRKISNLTKFNYNIKGFVIRRKETMRDLGVTYDTKLTFNEHVETVGCKARRMLGFIMRVGKQFKNPLTFTSLYNSLVRSHLEYASVIWNPHTAQQKIKIERVQHKFLRFVAIKCFGAAKTDNIDYKDIEKKIKLDTLELRREVADMKFTIKSFNDHIDGHTFLHHFNKTQKGSTRSTDTFSIKTCRTDTGKFSVVNRLMTNFNKYCSNDDWLNYQPNDDRVRKLIRKKSHDINQ